MLPTCYVRFFFLNLLCLWSALLHAQVRPGTYADSLRLTNRPPVVQLQRGLEWQTVRLDTLFGSPQNINILRLRPRQWRLAFASAGDSLWITSRLGREHNATAALNGTFFSFKGGSVDHIKIDGRVFDTTRYTPGKKLEEHRQAAIVLTKDRHVLLITADGRHKNAAGFSLPELTTVLSWLGCRDAINLDGGGSTTLWLSGQPDNGVVNYPSDSKQWIHTGERPVSNVLLVQPR
ncbi:MAG: phosphodiester glycosidase family protein [Cytophagaceae bacterium]|nr:MAG: phosphodiester glycosidase family protein [Cytophagaceae bacterium]